MSAEAVGAIRRVAQEGAPTVKVNRDKSKVVKAEEASFLGFIFTRKKLTVSEKSMRRFKSELLRLTGRSWGVSMDYRYYKIRTYIQGWMNYFGGAMKYNDALSSIIG